MSDYEQHAIQIVAKELGYSSKTIALDTLCPSGSDGAAIQLAVRQTALLLEAQAQLAEKDRKIDRLVDRALDIERRLGL